jgi:hypothetical protein
MRVRNPSDLKIYDKILYLYTSTATGNLRIPGVEELRLGWVFRLKPDPIQA